VTSETFTEKQVCSTGFMSDFTAACKRMLPLVEFLSRALRLPT
jgi:hypothetical protein